MALDFQDHGPANREASVPRADRSTLHVAGAHYAGLDGLRGAAVLGVMLFHSGLIRGGYLGVDVFFTLSGFLITSLLLEEHAATGAISMRRFYFRRALRLLPALFAFLGVWGGYLLATVAPAFWPLVGTYIALVAFYVANWGGISGFPLGIFGHTWSLAIEEQFYILWPLVTVLLVRCVRQRARIGSILLAAASLTLVWRVSLALSGAPERRIYWATDAHADGLLIGAALAFFVVAGCFTRFPRALAAAGPLAAVGLAGLLVAAPLTPYYAYGISALGALATAVIILDALTGGSRLTRLLETSWLARVGQISYGLYLWHFPVFVQFGTLKQPGDHAAYVRILLAWGVSFGAAALSYLVIERRALAFKDRFSWNRRRDGLGPGASAPAAPQVADVQPPVM